MVDPAQPLLESSMDADPVVQFGRWFEEAAAVCRLPEAVALATATPDGRPSVRMVLLKAWDGAGLLFHTNTRSRKGRELGENPVGAVVVHWDPLGRQVRAEGPVHAVDDVAADAYFATRPRGAQLGAWASAQSEPVADRVALDRRVAEEAARFAGQEVPRPPWWGGYRLVPEIWEFWQHRDDRLHDRLRYLPAGDGAWRLERLQP